MYLIGYNMLSFVLWYAVLVRVLYPFVMLPAVSFIDSAAGIDPSAPFEDSKVFTHNVKAPEVTEMPVQSLAEAVAQTFPAAGQFVSYVQTLAALEVLHSALGLVRAPLMTTGMQVASRFLLVWGICGVFGEQLLVPLEYLGLGQAAKEVVMGAGDAKMWNQWAYVGMLLAWSVTECVRYAYFVFFLTDKMPPAVEWMRYGVVRCIAQGDDANRNTGTMASSCFTRWVSAASVGSFIMLCHSPSSGTSITTTS